MDRGRAETQEKAKESNGSCSQTRIDWVCTHTRALCRLIFVSPDRYHDPHGIVCEYGERNENEEQTGDAIREGGLNTHKR